MRARLYKSGFYTDEVEGVRVVELFFDDNRSVQITAHDTDPPGEGTVLVRAWGPDGTAEFGGDNLDVFSSVFVLNKDGTIDLKHIDIRQPRKE